MIDISDGLSSEIMHLCKSSDLGCTIYEDKIPMDPQMIRLAEEFGINPITAVLNGGEDYELLFTISLGDYDKIKHNPSLTAIGHMTDSKPIQLITNVDHSKSFDLRASKIKVYPEITVNQNPLILFT